jgi:hypothetical protein
MPFDRVCLFSTTWGICFRSVAILHGVNKMRFATVLRQTSSDPAKASLSSHLKSMDAA